MKNRLMIGSLAVIICLVSFSSSKPKMKYEPDGSQLPTSLERLDTKMKIFADKLNSKLSKNEVLIDTTNSSVRK